MACTSKGFLFKFYKNFNMKDDAKNKGLLAWLSFSQIFYRYVRSGSVIDIYTILTNICCGSIGVEAEIFSTTFSCQDF